ncbi:hypothetical protein AAVH_42296, partial [Aphelenchoides avenae]
MTVTTNGTTLANGGSHCHTEIDMSKKVEGTQFTVGDFVSMMNAGGHCDWSKLTSAHALKDVTVQQISIAFMSFVARVTFRFEGVKEPFSVVVKVPSAEYMPNLNKNVTESYLDRFAGTLAESHDRELYLYLNLKDDRMPFHLPKVYASKTCGENKGRTVISDSYMFMEDLGVKGTSPDMISGWTKEQ